MSLFLFLLSDVGAQISLLLPLILNDAETGHRLNELLWSVPWTPAEMEQGNTITVRKP